MYLSSMLKLRVDNIVKQNLINVLNGQIITV